MTDELKDLEDITRFSAIEQGRRIELLRKYLDALTNCDVKEPDWLIASALLWASVMRANALLGSMSFHAKGMLAASPECLAEIGSELKMMMPLIYTLRARLPDFISKFDEIVSYAGRFERSWLNIAIFEADIFAVPDMQIDATNVGKVFELSEYDYRYVGLQLEREKTKYERIRFYPNDGSAGTAIGDALDKILRDKVKPVDTGGSDIGPFQLQWLKWIFEADHDNTLKERLGKALRGNGQHWYVASVNLKTCPKWKDILQAKSEDHEISKRTRSQLKNFLSRQ